MRIPIIFMFLLTASAWAQFAPFGGNVGFHSSGGTTISVTSAVCVNSSATATANCTLAASAAVGDLLIVKSKTATSGGTPLLGVTFSGTAACVATQVIAPVSQAAGGGTFTVGEYGCIVTSAGAAIPVATWTGTGVSATFTDVQAFTVHTSATWKTVFVDGTPGSNVATGTSTSCGTGTNSATTTATDFIFASCDVFNAAQTWGTLAGFTQYAAASRNTAGAYYKSVSSTGTQTATIPLSSTDFGVGLIAAFASN